MVWIEHPTFSISLLEIHIHFKEITNMRTIEGMTLTELFHAEYLDVKFIGFGVRHAPTSIAPA